jgi:ribosomal protein S18 acetylase RimI-like enzyme
METKTQFDISLLKWKSSQVYSQREQLLVLFQEMTQQDGFFKPHPFTADYITKVIYNPQIDRSLDKKDQYIIGQYDDKAIAYGLLRGMEEGYTMPSLGIYISKDYRGLGLSKIFMKELHNRAYDCYGFFYTGRKFIRLTVNKQNEKAINLYKSLGYTFTEKDYDNLIGLTELKK